MRQWLKDSDAVLDWRWDFSAWLADGEAITNRQVTAEGISVGNVSEADGVVTAWLSEPEEGFRHVRCRIETNQGRTDTRTLTIRVLDR